jgi:hypothetical protein
MNSSHSRAEMAHLLGLSETRLQQLTGLGIVTRNGGAYDPLQTALDYIKYLRRDEEAKAARLRQVNATALRIEQKVRREQRRMFVMDEVRQIALLIYDQAVEFVDSESTRIHHEYLRTHTEPAARILTGKIYDELRRIPDAWGEGVMQFCKNLDKDYLPSDVRLDHELAKIIREIAAAAKADEKKLAKPKPTP